MLPYLTTIAISASTQEVGIFITLLLFAFGHLFLVSRWAGAMQQTMQSLKEGFDSLKKELSEIRMDLKSVVKLESQFNTIDFKVSNHEERIGWLEEHCRLLTKTDAFRKEKTE